jgi:formate/nitrite transporter FocA (FNT family)
MFVVLAAGELIALGAAAVLWMQDGLAWWTAAAALVAAFFSLGMIDLAISRIELMADALHIVELSLSRSREEDERRMKRRGSK